MEITEHQANMLRALADGKRMQVIDKDAYAMSHEPFEITTLDNFMLFISSPDRYEVRIKPDVIIVNGIEVLAPEQVAPEKGAVYYVPGVTVDGWFLEAVWISDSDDIRLLERGLVFMDSEHAIAMAKAMLAHKRG